MPWYAESDIIIGQRVCQEAPSTTWRHLAAEGRNLIYELDDDLFHVDPSSPHAFAFFSQRQVQDRIRENATVASMVTVTTEPLAAVMREYNDNVVVIPNYVDEEIFDVCLPKSKHLTIGWAGSTTHQMDFDSVRGLLKTVAKRCPDVRFQFSGADYGRKMFPADRYTFLPYVTNIQEHYRLMGNANIGIAPLARHRFNSSKSALKFIEFAALGIPCVATMIDPYESVVEHGVTGFLVQHQQDWVTYLRALIEDAELATRMALNAYEAAHGWTIQRNIWKWEQVMYSLVSSSIQKEVAQVG